jgi:hypothetical protein
MNASPRFEQVSGLLGVAGTHRAQNHSFLPINEQEQPPSLARNFPLRNASASMPLSWSQVRAGLNAQRFMI